MGEVIEADKIEFYKLNGAIKQRGLCNGFHTQKYQVLDMPFLL